MYDIHYIIIKNNHEQGRTFLHLKYFAVWFSINIDV